MNTTLLPCAQPTMTKVFEYMPNKSNEHNIRNYNEVINITALNVLPMINRAQLLFDAHSIGITTKGGNKLLKQLKLKKRETSLAEKGFDKKLKQQASLGCLSPERRRGRLPYCNIPLDNELLKTTGERGVGFNAQNKDKLTPLMQAVATHKDVGLIKYLMSRGADMTLRDNENNTALMWLLKSLFRLKDEALITEKWKILDIFQQNKSMSNVPGTAGYTPLMVTVLGEDHRTFFKLLINGALTNATNDAKETALHLAIKYDTHWMISVILRYDHHDINIKDKNGHTPFMLATFRKNREIMDFYIRRGVNIDNTDAQGWTALMHAVNCGDVSMTEYLLSQGACVNYANRSNETAMRVALYKNDQQNVHVLSKAISALKAANKDCRPVSSGDHVPANVNDTAYTENDALKNRAVAEDNAGSYTETTDEKLNATETIINTMMTASDDEANTTEAMNETLLDKNEDTEYPLYENSRRESNKISTDLASTKSSGSSLFLSSHITGDIDKIYQSLKRIMSRRSVPNDNS
jgi:ankyrin repeat protein